MRAFAVAVIAVLAGCPANDEPYPITPGGGGGGSSNTDPDAADDDDDDAGSELLGRVCLVSDLRAPTTGCSGTAAGGLAVTLGTKTATTNADGTFLIDAPSGSDLTWHVESPVQPAVIVRSAMPFSADFVIPAISVDDYADLLATNGVLLTGGQGSIVARVVQGAAPIADAQTSVDPDSQFAPFYDGTSATSWDRDATGTRGTVWITGAAVGATDVAVVGTTVSTRHIVEDQAITFGTIEIP